MLYDLLDGLDYQSTIFIDNIAFECMELVADHNRLVLAVLKWSSSLYRQGLHRAYLVTRLLRRWNQAGIDICEGIINYLPEMASDCSKEPGPVFRIISELVRSKTFLIGRYLQWLIASGSLNPALHLQTVKTPYPPKPSPVNEQ
jgi:mediator of RNA polymerase II transcription subunit 12